MTLESRFWSKVDRSGECWLWLGRRAPNGYGHYHVSHPERRSIGAHRIAWELTYGPIPNGMFVCHRCDVKHCVRPDHLFLGDHNANMHDMRDKGRSTLGARNSHCKLTEADVLEIRRRVATGNEIQSVIATEFGIDQTTVSDIARRKLWRHVP